ncbi:MAG: hypothetical protein HAW63_05330 [Bdellovibrionaceae bacterium]|nr:hypothetical protein [Pseudobdellovibrionaceae bacterium]
MKLVSSEITFKNRHLNLQNLSTTSLFILDIVIFLSLQFYRFVHPLYLNESANALIYYSLIGSATLHLLYLFLEKKSFFPVLLVGKFLAIFLCFYSGLLPNSIFLVSASLYISCVGILYGFSSAVLFGTLVSFLLGANIALKNIAEPAVLWGQFVFSHILFFVTAYLSPFVIKKIQKTQEKLEKRTKDVLALKNLNELIVDNIQAGLLTINSALVIQAANKQAKKLLNCQSLEARDLLAFFPEITRKINLLFVTPPLGKKMFSCVFEEKHNERSFEVLISTMADDLLKTKIYTLLIQDITEKKQKEVLDRQKEKLAIVGSLAASIAHEIRNPLAGISGSVQMLQVSKNLESTESKELFSIISKEVGRLNNLITEFLDYSVEKPLVVSSINVSELIKEILQLLTFDKNYSSKIEQKLSLSSSIFIEGDVQRIKQSLLNFFINAYQAMQETANPRLSVKTYFENSYAVIDIEDNGCGMQEKDRLKIFEPFFTKKPNGTGLGLATSYNILRQHNCDVLVETEVNKGTRFSLKFPIFKYSSPQHERMKVA